MLLLISSVAFPTLSVPLMPCVPLMPSRAFDDVRGVCKPLGLSSCSSLFLSFCGRLFLVLPFVIDCVFRPTHSVLGVHTFSCPYCGLHCIWATLLLPDAPPQLVAGPCVRVMVQGHCIECIMFVFACLVSLIVHSLMPVFTHCSI